MALFASLVPGCEGRTSSGSRSRSSSSSSRNTDGDGSSGGKLDTTGIIILLSFCALIAIFLIYKKITDPKSVCPSEDDEGNGDNGNNGYPNGVNIGNIGPSGPPKVNQVQPEPQPPVMIVSEVELVDNSGYNV